MSMDYFLQCFAPKASLSFLAICFMNMAQCLIISPLISPFSTHVARAATQPALAADGALRPRDHSFFESWNRRDCHLDLERAAAEAQSVGPHLEATGSQKESSY